MLWEAGLFPIEEKPISQFGFPPKKALQKNEKKVLQKKNLAFTIKI